jgi:hypothetical protein
MVEISVMDQTEESDSVEMEYPTTSLLSFKNPMISGLGGQQPIETFM